MESKFSHLNIGIVYLNMRLSQKGQMSGVLTILISIIIIVAVALPITSNLITPQTVGTTINNTYTFTNSQGTSSFALNTYINGYKNNNVTAYSTAKTANFTGKTNGTAAFLILYINNVKTNTTATKVTSLSYAKYTLNYSKSATYKFTVASNETAFANTTYWLILKPEYYTTNAPNSTTINLMLDLIPLFIAILALLVVAKYMGFF